MDKSNYRLGETLLRILNKFNQNEKRPRYFGLDELLYPSEIHMLMWVGNNEGAHVSELARLAGITRGAVSQTVAKLQEKGLVKKVPDPENSLKTVPALTSKGKTAYWAHEHYHEELDADLCAYLEQLSADQFIIIENFLNKIDDMLEKRQ